MDASQPTLTLFSFGFGSHRAHPPIIEKSPEGHFSLVLTFSKEYPVLNKFSQVFSPSPPSPPDEPHVSRLPLDLVLSSCSKEASRAAHHDVAGAPMPWDGSNLTPFPPSSGAPSTHADVKPSALPTDEAASSRARPVRVDYSTLLEDAPNAHQARYSVVKGLVEDGLVFVTGMPTDVKGSQPDPRQADSPELARLATMFGEIRNTFYGMLWDVRSLPSSLSRNIAYTNVDLGLHMDLLYFQNPPRFQFLHMLRNQVKGGQSIFVDSYKVAEHLWTTDPDAWRILSSVSISRSKVGLPLRPLTCTDASLVLARSPSPITIRTTDDTTCIAIRSSSDPRDQAARWDPHSRHRRPAAMTVRGQCRGWQR